MTRIFWIFLVFAGMASGSAESRAQDILDKQLPAFSAKNGLEIKTLCRVAEIRCGEERPADWMTEKIQGGKDSRQGTLWVENKITGGISFDSGTVRSALEAIVARYPKYRWRVTPGGVLHVVPVEGAGAGVNGSALMDYVLPEGKISGDLLEICRFMKNGCRAVGDDWPYKESYNPADYADVKRATCAVTVSAGETLGEVLDEAGAQVNHRFWQIKPMPYKAIHIQFEILKKWYGGQKQTWEEFVAERKKERQKNLTKADRQREAEQKRAFQKMEKEWARKNAENTEKARKRAEDRRLMDAFDKETDGMWLSSTTAKGTDAIAAKYLGKSVAVDRYVLWMTMAYKPLDVQERRARKLLAEASDPKAFDHATVLRMLSILWFVEFEKGNYDKALEDYRAGLEKYGVRNERGVDGELADKTRITEQEKQKVHGQKP